jgi:hypothetical protein
MLPNVIAPSNLKRWTEEDSKRGGEGMCRYWCKDMYIYMDLSCSWKKRKQLVDHWRRKRRAERRGIESEMIAVSIFNAVTTAFSGS